MTRAERPASLAERAEERGAPRPSKQTTTSTPPVLLTRREEEIALLVARGLTNRQIAAELFISPRTVENHVHAALGKLGFSSRRQISAWVRQQRREGP